MIKCLKEASELIICVELMDASMDRFYQTMHALDKLSYTELDRVLCRLTHNVNKKKVLLKKKTCFYLLVSLIDNISTSFS